MYNVKLQPSQPFSGSAEAFSIDYSTTYLPQQNNPFFITAFNQGPGECYFVVGSDTSSGNHIAASGSLTIGPFKKDEAEDISIYCVSETTGSVSFTSVLQEL